MRKVVADLACIAAGHMLRIAFAYDHIAELEALDEINLAEVGRLLCHDSSIDMRNKYPIIGDYKPNNTGLLGLEIFGDPDSPERSPANYWGLPRRITGDYPADR